MDYQEAMAISMNSLSDLPLIMNISGLINRPSCVALTTDTSVQTLVNRVSPSFHCSDSKLHMSLYRMRGNKDWKEKKRQVDLVHDNVNRSFGTAKGLRVIRKESKADYFGRAGKFFRVLAEVSDSTVELIKQASFCSRGLQI